MLNLTGSIKFMTDFDQLRLNEMPMEYADERLNAGYCSPNAPTGAYPTVSRLENVC
jgi:hypothetical protein